MTNMLIRPMYAAIEARSYRAHCRYQHEADSAATYFVQEAQRTLERVFRIRNISVRREYDGEISRVIEFDWELIPGGTPCRVDLLANPLGFEQVDEILTFTTEGGHEDGIEAMDDETFEAAVSELASYEVSEPRHKDIVTRIPLLQFLWDFADMFDRYG